MLSLSKHVRLSQVHERSYYAGVLASFDRLRMP
jgi:hypothetical protein